MRPFCLSAGVQQRSYSCLLQRAVSDFGGDHAFGQVNGKLKEHYGIELPTHAARTVTLNHAHIMAEKRTKVLGRIANSPQPCVISETDGSMVPIVQTCPTQKDKRKHKQMSYREARLTLAHEQGSRTPTFSATLGNVKTAGAHISHCIRKVGIDAKTYIHGVGDGAPWIANQLEEQFGSQVHYLVDFYHVCEYLAAAASSCSKGTEKAWVEQQKALLKDNRAQSVLINLLPYIEPVEVKEEDAVVRTCHRYLQNRLHQLDYKGALAKGLPIGSGEIESAHRYVIQKRLKIQGAWWLEKNAEDMLALRTVCANHEWDDYWKTLAG